MKKIFIKLLALGLVCVTLIGLCACGARPITSTKQAKQSVGKVGNFDVTYEELYSIVNNYRLQLDVKYYDESISQETYKEELRTLVYDNIVSNYAVLTLASEEGITVDSEEVKESVQLSVESMIENDFGGKRSAYKRSLKENGLTDSYVRLSFGVDAVYSKLVARYLDNGIIKSDDAYIKQYIDNEFARTWHIMIVNDKTEASLNKAKEALALIESGRSMYDMIGSKYNEDYLMPYDGYYFPKGVMEEAYEDATFSLEIGKTSGIVAAKGETASGEPVDCFYIIQRLALDKDYISKNYDKLKEAYYGAAAFGMVSELQKTLKFEPNAYCEGLDLTDLAAPRTIDYVFVVAFVSIVVAVLIVVLVCLAIKKKIIKKNSDMLGTIKSERR